jgi:phage-related protein
VPTQAVYYRDADGSEPVREFIDREPPARQLILEMQIERLNGLADDDPPLPFPHTSQVDRQLRELRCHYGRAHYRILYRRSGNLFVLLHMFRKTNRSIPQSEAHLAHLRWADFKRRMDVERKVHPRAVGGDAP